MDKKALVQRGMLFLLAAAVLAFAAFAWFTSNRVADVKPIMIQTADASKIDAKLYHKRVTQEGEEVYDLVSRIECSRYLPGQTETYKLVLTNIDSAAYSVRVDFLRFRAANSNEENMRLCDKLTLQNILATPPVQEGEMLTPSGAFSALYARPDDALNTSILFANSILLDAASESAAGERALYFDITLPGDTDNSYQTLEVTLDSIAIQATQIN